MRFLIAFFLITYTLSAETNTSSDITSESNKTSVIDENSTDATDKSTKPDYTDYYALKKGKISQSDLFGKWIDVPRGDKRDPYNSDVVDVVTQEIEQMQAVKFIGQVKIYKLKINQFADDDNTRSISYKAKIIKSYMPEGKSGDIEFDLTIETDEKFNPENGSKAVVVLTNETGRYQLDQFMVLPPQNRLERNIVRLKSKSKIHDLMTQEIKDGYKIENVTKETISPTHKIDKEYVRLLEIYLDDALEKADYNFPSRKRFAKKVKKIFDITLNQTEQVNINSCSIDNDPKTKYIAHSIDTNRTIFLKNKRFIMFAERFPMLMDYRKYADLNTTTVEKKDTYTDQNGDTFIITTWQDIYDKNMTRGGIKTFVRLNKYLFNSEDQYLNWLYKYEPEFMNALVTKYGYRGDKRLIRKIISSRDKNESISLDGLIYFKSCKRGVSSSDERGFFIFDQTFRYLRKKLGDKKYSKPADNKYLTELDRILKELEANDTLWVAQKDKIRLKIEKLMQKHLKPAPIENNATKELNTTQESNITQDKNTTDKKTKENNTSAN